MGTCGPTRCATSVGSGVDTRVVVDLVLHLDDGATGPGSRWAATAATGDRLLLVGAAPG